MRKLILCAMFAVLALTVGGLGNKSHAQKQPPCPPPPPPWVLVDGYLTEHPTDSNYYLAYAKIYAQGDPNFTGTNWVRVRVYDENKAEWTLLDQTDVEGKKVGTYLSWKGGDVVNAAYWKYSIHKTSDWGKEITGSNYGAYFDAALDEDNTSFAFPEATDAMWAYLGDSAPRAAADQRRRRGGDAIDPKKLGELRKFLAANR